MKKITKTIVGGVLFVALYTAAWFYMAGKLEDHILTQIAILKNKGYDVQHDGVLIGGYPVAISAAVKNPHLTRVGILEAWVEGDMVFKAHIWNPYEATSVSSSPFYLAYGPQGHLLLEGQGMQMTLFPLDRNHFEVTYEGMSLKHNDVEVLKVNETHIEVDQKGTEDMEVAQSLDFNIAIHDIEGSLLNNVTLGDQIDVLKAQGTLYGKFAGNSLQEKLARWYHKAGTINFKSLFVQWGDLKLNIDGTMALDEQLQPLAALTVNVDGLDAVLDTMVQNKTLPPEAAGISKLAMSLFAGGAKPKSMDEADADSSHVQKGVRLSLTVQNGHVSIGPLPLISLPRVDWKALVD
jgi:hypothetical protein